MKTIQIDGVLYQRDEGIFFHQNNFLQTSKLADDSKINGIMYRQNTYIHYYDNGKVRSGNLVKETKINDIFYKDEIFFHNNSLVDFGMLSKEHWIKIKNSKTEYNIKLLNNTLIYFHKNGNIRKGTLAGEININGETYKAKSLIEFDENRNIIKGKK